MSFCQLQNSYHAVPCAESQFPSQLHSAPSCEHTGTYWNSCFRYGTKLCTCTSGQHAVSAQATTHDPQALSCLHPHQSGSARWNWKGCWRLQRFCANAPVVSIWALSQNIVKLKARTIRYTKPSFACKLPVIVLKIDLVKVSCTLHLELKWFECSCVHVFAYHITHITSKETPMLAGPTAAAKPPSDFVGSSGWNWNQSDQFEKRNTVRLFETLEQNKQN